jgi:hypothetical protein
MINVAFSNRVDTIRLYENQEEAAHHLEESQKSKRQVSKNSETVLLQKI